MALAGGDDERGPSGRGLLVDGQLDLPRVEVGQDLFQRRHVALGRDVVEHCLLLLQLIKYPSQSFIPGVETLQGVPSARGPGLG